MSRAAVFHAPGAPLELREVALPPLAAQEVLVRVRLTTLCGSDLSTYAGKRSSPTPTILGHEIIGDVVAIGDTDLRLDLRDVPLQVGDRVTWSIASNCGHCFSCEHEMPQKCDSLFKYGHERLTESRPLSGGLAEHCVLTADTPVLKLPAALDDSTACIANCATATVAGAIRTGGGCRGRSVLILGAGMLGLNAAAMAKLQGAATVIVSDISAERLAQAARFGATHQVLASPDVDFAAAVRKLTGGRGADLVLELSGSPIAMENSLQAARIGGTIVFVGAVSPTRPLAVDGEQIVRRLLTIRGLHNYVPQDLAAAVDFLAAAGGRFPLSELVSEPYPLDKADEAFAAALAGKALRVAVRP